VSVAFAARGFDSFAQGGAGLVDALQAGEHLTRAKVRGNMRRMLLHQPAQQRESCVVLTVLLQFIG
jgi:hypothetical protein